MSELSPELIKVILQLLPGFLVGWIVYTFTAHPKPSAFERVVEALVYTMLVRGALVGVHAASTRLGPGVGLTVSWTESSDLVASIITAGAIGLAFSWCMNHDALSVLRPGRDEDAGLVRSCLHWCLGRLRITEKTLYPSEWWCAFSTSNRWVVLHLAGERRLYGWPRVYADQPNEGHLIISEPAWLLDDGTVAKLHVVKSVLVRAADVEWVEFLKDESEITATRDEVDQVMRAIVAANEQTRKERHADQPAERSPASAHSSKDGAAQPRRRAEGAQTTASSPRATDGSAPATYEEGELDDPPT
jgi:hypothetical protein